MITRPLSYEITKSDCFIVTSHRPGTGGYVQIMVNGNRFLAHRYIWEQNFGPVSPNLCVCHHCDNPRCINPKHLFLGTHIDNMQDMKKKNRQVAPRGEQQGQAKLTVEQVREIRKRYQPRNKNHGQHAMAHEFKVSRATIYHAIHGISWGWLKEETI